MIVVHIYGDLKHYIFTDIKDGGLWLCINNALEIYPQRFSCWSKEINGMNATEMLLREDPEDMDLLFNFGEEL